MTNYDEKSGVTGDKVNKKSPDEKINDTWLSQIYESKKQAYRKLAGDDNLDPEDPRGWEQLCKMYPFRFEDASTGLSYLKTAQLDDTNYDNWIGVGTPRWISAMEVKRAVDDYLSKKGYAISKDDDCISALIFGSSTTSVQIKDHQIIGFKFSAKKDDEKIFIYAIGRPNLPEIENLAYDAQLNALLAKIMCVQPEKNVSFVFALPEDYKSRFIIKKHRGARYKFITLEDAPVDFSIYFTNVNTGVVEERRWREFFG